MMFWMYLWMRSSQKVRASDLRCRRRNIVLGSIPASSDTLESEGRQMKKCWIKFLQLSTNIHTIFTIVSAWARQNAEYGEHNFIKRKKKGIGWFQVLGSVHGWRSLYQRRHGRPLLRGNWPPSMSTRPRISPRPRPLASSLPRLPGLKPRPLVGGHWG
jgi:hypothetical protein